jgi:hypothetical protein
MNPQSAIAIRDRPGQVALRQAASGPIVVGDSEYWIDGQRGLAICHRSHEVAEGMPHSRTVGKHRGISRVDAKGRVKTGQRGGQISPSQVGNGLLV